MTSFPTSPLLCAALFAALSWGLGRISEYHRYTVSAACWLIAALFLGVAGLLFIAEEFFV